MATRVLHGAMFLLVTALSASAVAAVTVSVGDVSGTPGSVVAVPVSVDPGDATVAGAQNDLGYDPAVLTLELRNGRPDCTLNPAIEKILTGTVLADGASLRLIVFALTDVDPIPAGVLYTCNFRIAPLAAPGSSAVTISRITVSDPMGHALPDVAGQDGSVTVSAAPPVDLTVGSASGMAGDTVSVTVSLASTGHAVAGVQNDIRFDATAVAVNPSDGHPDCQINPATGKLLSASLLDAGSRLRAIVYSLDDQSPISDGALYTCTFSILEATPPGDYPLIASNVVVADASAATLDSVAQDGAISVAASQCAGDCNGDGAVTVDDLVKAANIALGAAAVGTCPAADLDHDGEVIITEILTAVLNAQSGCEKQ